jgi:hypothetical protein
MKLKTFPKVMIGLVVLGGAGYAAMQVDLSKHLPKPAATPPAVVEAAPEPVQQAEVQVIQQPQAQAPVQQAPVQQPQAQQPANDAGLAAVLGAKKK